MQTQMKYLSGVKLSWFTFRIMIYPLACSFLHLASWVELLYSSLALDAMRAIRSLTREALWIYIYACGPCVHIKISCKYTNIQFKVDESSRVEGLENDERCYIP